MATHYTCGCSEVSYGLRGDLLPSPSRCGIHDRGQINIETNIAGTPAKDDDMSNQIHAPSYGETSDHADEMRMSRARVHADVAANADAMNYHLIEARAAQQRGLVGQTQLHQGLPSKNDPDLGVVIPSPKVSAGVTA